jgi:hypothetical protein
MAFPGDVNIGKFPSPRERKYWPMSFGRKYENEKGKRRKM